MRGDQKLFDFTLKGGKDAVMTFGVVETVDAASVLSRRRELIEELFADKVRELENDPNC